MVQGTLLTVLQVGTCNNQSNKKDRKDSEAFTGVPTKNYTFTSVLYSSSIILKCSSLICNSNEILQRWDAYLNRYNRTDENICKPGGGGARL